jgi:hypothetical protein
VDPRAGLDDMEKRKFVTLPGLKLRPLIIQPIASRYIDYATLAPFLFWGSLKIKTTIFIPSFTKMCSRWHFLRVNPYVVKRTSDDIMTAIRGFLTPYALTSNVMGNETRAVTSRCTAVH